MAGPVEQSLEADVLQMCEVNSAFMAKTAHEHQSRRLEKQAAAAEIPAAADACVAAGLVEAGERPELLTLLTNHATALGALKLACEKLAAMRADVLPGQQVDRNGKAAHVNGTSNGVKSANARAEFERKRDQEYDRSMRS